MPQPNLLGNVDLGFCYRNRTSSTGATTSPLATPANYMSPTTIDTRLTAINGSLFTAAYLAKLTLNDKLFELRRRDDAASV
jgi:hypothetical protein